MLDRIRRYYNFEVDFWWPGACLGVLVVTAWRCTDAASLVILWGGAAILFAAAYFLRHDLIRYYRQVRRGLFLASLAALVGVLLSRLWGYPREGALAFALFCAFTLGVLFWSASDPMFEMACWLAFPTEWGRLPDDILLVDTRRVTWPGDATPVRCWLFKFRYDDEWSYGIVGPITFASFEGNSYEEIYAAYTGWYEREGVGEMIEKHLEEERDD